MKDIISTWKHNGQTYCLSKHRENEKAVYCVHVSRVDGIGNPCWYLLKTYYYYNDTPADVAVYGMFVQLHGE